MVVYGGGDGTSHAAESVGSVLSHCMLLSCSVCRCAHSLVCGNAISDLAHVLLTWQRNSCWDEHVCVHPPFSFYLRRRDRVDWNWIRCDAIRYDAVRCDAVRCDAMRCGAMRCGAMRCDAMRCDAVRCGAMRCDAMRCDAMRCDAVRCDAMRCGAIGLDEVEPGEIR